MRRNNILWAITLMMIFVFYAWTSISSSPESLISKTPYGDFYNRLVPQIIKGKFYLPDNPDKKLLDLTDPYDPSQRRNIYYLWDASLYKGKYTIYWGITPLLVSYLPFFIITNHYLPEPVWLCLYVFAGVYFAYKTILHLLSYLSRETTFSERLQIFFICSFSSFYPFILRRPAIYEIAIGSAFCFTWISCFLFIKALNTVAHRKTNLALSGLTWGLAVGSRPTSAVLVFFFLVPIILYFLARRKGSSWIKYRSSKIAHLFSDKKFELVAFLTPLFFMIGIICCYNFIRYENIFEFGFKYQLNRWDMKDQSLKIKNVWNGIVHYLLTPPRFLKLFPFVQVPWRAKLSFFNYHPNSHDPILGFFYACPFVLAYIFVKQTVLRNVKLFLFSAALLGMGVVLLVVDANRAVAGRYVGDWSIFFIIPVVLLYYLNKDESYFWLPRNIIRWGFLCCLVFSIGINFLISFTGEDGRLEKIHPQLFHTLQDTLQIKVPVVPIQITSQELEMGLIANYFNGTDCKGVPILTKVEPGHISFNFSRESKPYKAPFSIEWSGYIQISKKGIYKFATRSDDGSQLYLNERIIVDNGGHHPLRYISNKLFLDKGLYRIRITYFDSGGESAMELLWSSPDDNGEEHLIPSGVLFHKK